MTIGRHLSDVRDSARRDRWPHGVAILIAVAVLLAPMYLTSRDFGEDWGNHLWLLWVQGLTIRDMHEPSVFLHADPLGVFLPFYGMYGGTLYAIGGGISAALGTHPIVSYIGMWALVVVMAYGGLLWLSLLSGLRGARAHAAPVMYVTSAYFITDMYTRGVLPELIATSALCVVLAATVHLVRAPRVRFLPAAAFVGAVVLFTGSHNISLAWGAVFAAALGVTVLIALPRHGRELPAPRLLMLAGLALLAIGVNAWFLLPDLFYSSRTLIAASVSNGLEPKTFDAFGRLSVLLNPVRYSPQDVTRYDATYTQLPVFVLVWLLVAIPLAWRRERTRAWHWLTLGVTAIFGALVVLMLARTLWEHLPKFLVYVQFGYRLETYALLCISLLLIAALRVSPAVPNSRRLHAALAVVLVYGAGLAVWQIWTAPVSAYAPDRSEIFASGRYLVPPTWYSPAFYRDNSAPAVAVAPGRSIRFAPATVHDDRLRATVTRPRGPQPFSTNIAAGTYLIDVHGLKPVGHTPTPQYADAGAGLMVLQREAGSHSANQLEISPRKAGPLVIGRWISVASILALAGLAGAALVTSLRRRRGSR